MQEQSHSGSMPGRPIHVFDSTDTTMTNYLGFEQSGDGGTHHRTIPYLYFGDYLLSPYCCVF